jgi:predicted acylesterase/phospholipase RssA
MGALVGGLYASAPEADPVQRYRDFISLYAKRTTHEAQQTGLLGALLLGGIALATGGALAAVAVAVGVGAGVGAASIDPIQLERTAGVYDEFVDHATFERLPVEFVTYYLELTRTGAKMQVADEGPIAAGVQRSIANPLVFQRLDVKEAGYVDPGVDRIAAIAIRDTCERFPKARLLVIRLAGGPRANPPSSTA